MELFQIQSDFYLPQGAEEIEPMEVATRIQEAFSNAKIDWNKGRAKAQRRLDELIAKGCPEIIYRGQQRLLDKMFYAEIPVPNSQATLQGYCFGFTHYDGCISLTAFPDDIEALKCGSQEFVGKLAIEHTFYTNFGNIEFRCTAKRKHSPQTSLELMMSAVETNSSADRHIEWESIKNDIADWYCNLLANTDPNQSIGFPTGAEIHKQLVAAILSIGPVMNIRCEMDSKRTKREYLIDYQEWTAVLSIPSAALYFEPMAE